MSQNQGSRLQQINLLTHLSLVLALATLDVCGPLFAISSSASFMASTKLPWPAAILVLNSSKFCTRPCRDRSIEKCYCNRSKYKIKSKQVKKLSNWKSYEDWWCKTILSLGIIFFQSQIFSRLSMHQHHSFIASQQPRRGNHDYFGESSQQFIDNSTGNMLLRMHSTINTGNHWY